MIRSTIDAAHLRIAAAMMLTQSATLAQYSPGAPYSSRTEIADLMSDVTLYVSYDAASLQPDFAAGDEGLIRTLPGKGKQGTPSKLHPEFAPGISGLAVRADGAYGFYSAKGNVDLEAGVAVTFWINSVGGSSENDTATYFFSTSGGYMGVERVPVQGDARCQEFLAAYAAENHGQRTVSVLHDGELKRGTWHFVVVNWAWPTFSLSVDGAVFSTRSLSHYPADVLNKISVIQLGCGGGAPTLMDEVMVFNRALVLSEVRTIYHHLMARVPVPTPGPTMPDP